MSWWRSVKLYLDTDLACPIPRCEGILIYKINEDQHECRHCHAQCDLDRQGKPYVIQSDAQTD